MITKEYLQQELRRRIDSIKPGVETTTDLVIGEMKSILVLVEALQDYEKKYNEALEVMRQWIAPCHTKKQLDVMKESVFPELRESEDERIRKDIIRFLKVEKEDRDAPFFDIAIAYLEKQKEQKPRDYCSVRDEFDLDGNLKQKPAEVNEYEIIKKHITEDSLSSEVNKRLTECGWYVTDEKPAEWSEEDKDMLNCCISSIEEAKENRYAYKETDGDTSYDREIAFLKSLRPSWKPSEEQMEALMLAIEGKCLPTSYMSRRLEDLYEQLKKL